MNMNERSKMWIAYDKALSVIFSCKDMDQLVQAKRYIDLYKDKWEDYVSYSRLHAEMMEIYSGMHYTAPKKRKTVTK